MAIIVKKFGGTSVGSIERIRNVAALIKAHLQANPQDQVVVVASAMAGETNRLIAMARECVKTPDPRELDQMVATGEQVSIALLAMALIEAGIPARSMLGMQAGIATDRHYTGAHISDIDPKAVRELVDAGIVPVIAGFQGIDESHNITTLGRGGSDITAVAVAAAIKASACYIYTDVEGVFTTDPRICREARLLDRLCHEEMLEMASLGAKVLHPRSVYFAMCYNVPLVVLSTFNPGPGTWIVKEEELMEKPVVSGITYRNDETRVVVSGLKGGIRSLNRLFGELAEEGIFVDMITQTGMVQGETTVSFTVLEESRDKALTVARRIGRDVGAGEISADGSFAKVSIVGIGMKYHAGVASRMFATLAAEGIDVQMIGTSELKLSVLVDRKYCELAVRSLHTAFIQESPTVAVES